MKCKISTIVIFLVLITTVNLAAVPETINFQGALKDADGVPVNDTQFMEFRIYDSGNNLLWSEQHLAVEIEDGIFSEELGNLIQFPPGLFENQDRFITFFYGGEEMIPWQKLNSVPYALQAESTNLIQDVPLSGLVQEDMSGNTEITGTMTADSFVGDGSGLTNLGSFDDLYVNTTEPDTISAAPPSWNTGVLNINHQGYEGSGLIITDEGGMGTGIEMSNISGNGIYLTNVGGYSYRAIGGYSHFRSHSSENFGLEVYSSGNHGINMSGIGGDGIHIESATGDLFQGGEDGSEVFKVANDGVTSISAAPPSWNNGVLNINHQGYEGSGLIITDEGGMGTGIEMSNISGNGIYLTNVGGYSYRAIGGYSHFRSHSSENFGLEVYSSGDHGINMSGIGGDGLNIGSADGDGVYANTTLGNHEWGFNTPDKINGSNITTRSQSTHVRYVGNDVLEAGDLVCIAGGYEENVLGEDDNLPVVHVTKANSINSEAVLGVVEYKVHVHEKVREHEDETRIDKSFRFAEGSISNGDYLSVIVFGPVDVNVDSRFDITKGEKLTVADNGYARSINDEDNWRIGILGKALEDSNGKGKIKVYVNCR